jgi:hypothetical protein
MSETYIFEGSIPFEAKITADSPEEAQAKFEQLSTTDLASEGTVELLSGPETEAEREAYWKSFRSKIFPKTEAANG